MALKYEEGMRIADHDRSSCQFVVKLDQISFLICVDGALLPTTTLEPLGKRYSGQFNQVQQRILQRQVRDWRTLYGSEQETFFPQEHLPGQEEQLDFTHCSELGGSINGDCTLIWSSSSC